MWIMWIWQPILMVYDSLAMCYTNAEFSIRNSERCGAMFTVRINERGQITIPKELRTKAKINPKDNLEIELDSQGRLTISKKDIFSDLEDLIRRDLVSEGYSEYKVETMIPQRKRELGMALLEMSDNAESEIAKGEYSSLEELKKELDSKGQ